MGRPLSSRRTLVAACLALVATLVVGCPSPVAAPDDVDAGMDAAGAAVCGNGVLEPGEACDNGSANSDRIPNACRSNCVRASCGDGTTDASELCDEGSNNNDTAPNRCRTDCQLPLCGDGILDTAYGEQCDDGNTADLDGCSASCIPEICGNGIREGGEVCDDGNFQPGDGCSPDCRSDESCGNAIPDFEAGETCDCGRDASALRPGCAAINGDPDSPCTADLARCRGWSASACGPCA